MNKEGAIAGMIVGILFTAAYIWYFKPQLGGPGTPEGYWFGIKPEGIGVLGMLFNLVVSLVVSRMTSEPPQDIQELVEDIRIPRGSGAAIEH